MGRGVDKVDFTILLVSRDEELRRTMVSWFEGEGGHVVLSEGGRPALALVRRGNVDLVVWDGEVDGELEEVCREAKRHYPRGMVLWVSDGAPPRWVQVDGVLERPVRKEEVERFLNRIDERRRFLSENGLIGRSEAMQEVFETALEVAPTDVQVLLTGENGTGKDLLAKAIHNHSSRRDKPFIPVNCGAIPESLIESELFGYERGAFTGATGRRIGVFEAADGGTLFLDEIGEMPLSAQVKLLRVLDEKKIMRVGGREQIPVDVRVLAATNRDLRQEVLEGNFRRDLYYRLKVVEIHIPPLRARPEDIPLLVQAFVDEYVREHNLPFGGISEDAMEVLMRYPWPGNVRELRNVVERMIVLSKGRRITASEVSQYLDERFEPSRNLPVATGKTPDQVERELIYRVLLEVRQELAEIKDLLLRERKPEPVPYVPKEVEFVEEPAEEVQEVKTMEEVEKEMIQKALRQTGGNRRKAAKLLGIGERTLYRKLHKYGLR